MSDTIYKTTDGKEFDSEYEARSHQDGLDRSRAARDELIHYIMERQRGLTEQFRAIDPIGMKCLKDGDYDTAIDYLKAILVLHREHHLLQMGLDNLVKDDKFASQCFDDANEVELPKKGDWTVSYWGPYRYIGEAYYHKGDYKQALEYLNRSEECLYGSGIDKKILNGNACDVMLWRGNAHEKLGDMKSAIAEWKLAHDYAVCDDAVKNLARHGINYKRRPKRFGVRVFLPVTVGAVVFALIYGLFPAFNVLNLIVGAVAGGVLGGWFYGDKRSPSIFKKVGIAVCAIVFTFGCIQTLEGLGGVVNVLIATAIGAAAGWGLGLLVEKSLKSRVFQIVAAIIVLGLVAGYVAIPNGTVLFTYNGEPVYKGGAAAASVETETQAETESKAETKTETKTKTSTKAKAK